MRTVAIINQKGGCGKTTTSINLAACMARLGNKTLLVDVDPQGHCGVGLAVPEDQIERTIYDALIEHTDGKPADISQIVWQISSDFDLAPSNIRLAAFEQVFSHRPGRDERLRLALDRVKANYQWCVIDCPPSVGLLTFNALKACDEVIVPVETGFFSLHGLAKMMETLEVMRNRCNRDILIRILPTLYDTRTKLAREVLSELRGKFKQYLMESTVNFNTKLKEAASFGQPITEYDPGSRGYRDFVNLARELMGRELAQSAPVADEKLSRPQELVQRARQLAQLANTQFGRTVVATPTQTPAPARIQAPAPAPVQTPAQAPMSAPARFVPTAPAARAPFAPEPGPIARPASNPAPSAIPSLISFTQPVAPTPAAPIPAAPAPAFSLASLPRFQQAPQTPAPAFPQISARLGAWPPATELLLPTNRHLDSIATVRSSHPQMLAPSLTLPVKTTEQKIDEFYGVKQVGSDIVFAAHFDLARTVFIAGDFNNWTPQITPMTNGKRPGDWRKVLVLAPGRYKYRLVVDGRWVTDPNNHYVEANQFGELDNVIEVASPKAAVAQAA